MHWGSKNNVFGTPSLNQHLKLFFIIYYHTCHTLYCFKYQFKFKVQDVTKWLLDRWSMNLLCSMDILIFYFTCLYICICFDSFSLKVEVFMAENSNGGFFRNCDPRLQYNKDDLPAHYQSPLAVPSPNWSKINDIMAEGLALKTPKVRLAQGFKEILISLNLSSCPSRCCCVFAFCHWSICPQEICPRLCISGGLVVDLWTLIVHLPALPLLYLNVLFCLLLSKTACSSYYFVNP